MPTRLFVSMLAACLSFVASPARALVEIYVNPDCPSPADDISVLVRSTVPAFVPPDIFPPGVPPVTISGTDIKLVGRASSSYIGPAVPHSVTFAVGTLPVGAYHVELYGRFSDGFGNLGPEELAGTKDFLVQDNPPACTPYRVTVAQGGTQSTLVGQLFPMPLQVRVTDAMQRPVAGVAVNFRYGGRPEDLIDPNATKPDVVFGGTPATTDAAGLAEVTATANNVVGTGQYVAYITRAGVTLSTYFVLSNRNTTDGLPLEPVVEYFNEHLGHYFMTANPAEMEILDQGLLVGWVRTGGAFLAFNPGAPSLPASTNSVCRYYGRPEAGLNSHFFSASQQECREVAERFSAAWLLETDDAFQTYLPNQATGTCPANTAPVYRAYNGRTDANHRYSTSKRVIDEMIQVDGWIAEGYGPDAVVMCSPL